MLLYAMSQANVGYDITLRELTQIFGNKSRECALGYVTDFERVGKRVTIATGWGIVEEECVVENVSNSGVSLCHGSQEHYILIFVITLPCDAIIENFG